MAPNLGVHLTKKGLFKAENNLVEKTIVGDLNTLLG